MTAIEQLIDEIKMIQKGSVNKKESKSLKSLNGIIRLAEKKIPIEKQQMEKMFTAGAANAAKLRVSDNKLTLPVFEFEEYYKTTFNK